MLEVSHPLTLTLTLSLYDPHPASTTSAEPLPQPPSLLSSSSEPLHRLPHQLLHQLLVLSSKLPIPCLADMALSSSSMITQFPNPNPNPRFKLSRDVFPLSPPNFARSLAPRAPLLLASQLLRRQ